LLGREAKQADTGQAVTLLLDREVDVSRGCVLARESGLEVSDMLTATLLWMDETELIAGRNYLFRLGTKTVPGMVMAIKSRIDIDTGELLAADRLLKNEIGLCDVALTERIAFDRFVRSRAMGGMILIDRVTNATVAGGVVEHGLRRANNVIWQETDVTREVRSRMKGQQSLTLWFTGLSGSGKSTLANAVEKRLVELGKHTMLLDGDNVRHGLNKNLGFKEVDRVENIRRIAEVARLMNDAGLIVLTSFISPYACDRENARAIIGESTFIEIFVSTPLVTCERRDVKGLYKKARAGDIPEFTGISSPYEPPPHADLVIDTTQMTVDEATGQIITYLHPILKGGQL